MKAEYKIQQQQSIQKSKESQTLIQGEGKSNLNPQLVLRDASDIGK